MVRYHPHLPRRRGVSVRAALLAVVAALFYAVGFVMGKCVALLLWCWVAAVQGYKAGF